MAITSDDLLTIEGAAQRIGCSVATIRYRMTRVGLKPTYTYRGPSGRALIHLFDPDDLDAYFGDNPLTEDGRRGVA